MVGIGRRDIPEQVRVDRVLGSRFARIWAWCKAKNAHFAHKALYRRPRNRHFPVQYHRDPPGSVVGMLGVDAVDAVLNGDLARRRRHRPVEQTGITHSQQFCLHLVGEL